MNKECKNRLNQIRTNQPEVFSNRKLYVTVHKMFEGYTFKLQARQDVLKLFLPQAAQRRNMRKSAFAELSF